MTDRTYNVLFLCTGNSARSILAESLMNHWGKARFRGYSAGSDPKGAVHPYMLELLDKLKLPTKGLCSKSWDAFAASGAPKMDFVITVCDQAAGEACPVWPGNPITAHWGIPDPAAVQGSEAERRKAFRHALGALQARIKLFTSLRPESLDRIALKRRVEEIGREETPESVVTHEL
jgi:arsenate reductase